MKISFHRPNNFEDVDKSDFADHVLDKKVYSIWQTRSHVVQRRSSATHPKNSLLQHFLLNSFVGKPTCFSRDTGH